MLGNHDRAPCGRYLRLISAKTDQVFFQYPLVHSTRLGRLQGLVSGGG